MALIYLPGREGGGVAGGVRVNMIYPPMMSTGTYAKVTYPPPPPSNQSKYTWDMLGAAWGKGTRVWRGL